MTKNLNPHISVDCVVFGFDGQDLKLLLIHREKSYNEENSSKLKLPGGLIRLGEPLIDSASRTLHELTGLTDIYLKQFSVFDDPERLSSREDLKWLKEESEIDVERVITVAYYSLIKIDESKTTHLSLLYGANWYKVNEIPSLIFDHNEILKSGLKTVRAEILTQPLVYELLPEKFTLNQVQKVYETILDLPLDNRNFRKRIQRMEYIIPLNEKQTGVAHKPAKLYQFDRSKFNQFMKNYNGFII